MTTKRIYLDNGPVAKSDRVESLFSGPTEVNRTCCRPDALTVRQIFGIGRDSARLARAGPVDVFGFARRKHNLTSHKKQGWRLACRCLLLITKAANPGVNCLGSSNAWAWPPRPSWSLVTDRSAAGSLCRKNMSRSLSRCTKLGDCVRLPFKCKSDAIRNGREFTSSGRNLAI